MPASQWEPKGSVHTFQDEKTGLIFRMVFDGESLRPIEPNDSLPAIEAEIDAVAGAGSAERAGVATKLVRELRAVAAAGADTTEVSRLKRRIYVELLDMDPGALGPTTEATLATLSAKAVSISEQLDIIASTVDSYKGASLEERAMYGTEAATSLRLFQEKVSNLRRDALSAGYPGTTADELMDRIRGIKRSIYVDLLSMDPAVLTQ